MSPCPVIGGIFYEYVIMKLQVISSYKAFGGTQSVYEHISTACGGVPMRFSVFTPKVSHSDPLPVLFVLPGMGTDGELAATMYGGQEYASRFGMMLVFPDVSPRAGVNIEPANQLIGEGNGHYVNATRAPWDVNYRMYDYIHSELPMLVNHFLDGDRSRVGYTGFASGASAALFVGIRNPSQVLSISAISPIASLVDSAWGDAIIPNYFRNEEDALPYDVVDCIRRQGYSKELFIDIAADDVFVLDVLCPKLLVDACNDMGINTRLRVHDGYDHDYWMVRTFMSDHINFHARQMGLV